MASATSAKVFNYEKFGKLVRLFDSDSVGERDVAVMQALKQCRQHDPPIPFWEAAGAVFGNMAQGEVDRLEERAQTAEAEARNQRQAAERAAEEARQQREISERLKAENLRLTEDVRRVARASRGGFEWPDIALLRPHVLLVVLGLVIASEWVTVAPLGISWLGGAAPFVAQWLHLLAMMLFILWSVAGIKCGDSDDVFGGWILWIFGWAFVVFWVSATNAAFYTGTLAFNQLLLPYCWWSTMGAAVSAADCWLVLAVVFLTVDLHFNLMISRSILGLLLDGLRWLVEAVENFKA